MTKLFYPAITKEEYQRYLIEDSDYREESRKLISEKLGYEPDLAISFLQEIFFRETLMKYKQDIIQEDEYLRYLKWYCNIIHHVTENGTDEPDPEKRLMRGLIYLAFKEDPELRRLKAEKESALAINRSGFPDTANANLRPGAGDLKRERLQKKLLEEKCPNAIKFEDLEHYEPPSKIKPISFKDLF